GLDAGTDLGADLEEEAHAAEHQPGGADPVAAAAPGPNAIPQTGAAGLLDAWITDARAQADDLSDDTTDELAEGAANRYYSDALARAALSGVGPIDYDDQTGEIG